MNDIVTLTMNPAVDTSFTVKQVVAERKLSCSHQRQDPGGGGINVSRAVLKLGGTSRAYYPAGGPNGARLKHFLDREELDHEQITIDGNVRENIVAYEESSGRQFRFGMPGAELSREEWERCLDVVRRLDPFPHFVIASGSLPPGVPVDFYARFARMVKERGGRPIVDTKGEPLRAAVEEGVFLIKPNLAELSDIFGERLEGDRQIEEKVKEFIRKGGSSVVLVSLGSAGALFITEGKAHHIHAPTVPVESKIGAGDSMTAGTVLKLSQGEELLAAVMYGIAAGAAAVMTPGTELCRKSDADRLYREMREPM